jgi:rhomboid-like protein
MLFRGGLSQRQSLFRGFQRASYHQRSERSGPSFLRPVVFSLSVAGLSFGLLAQHRADALWEQEKLRATLWDPLRRLRQRILAPPPPLLDQTTPDRVFKLLSDVKDLLIFKLKSLTEAEKLAASLILVNSLVFAAWQVPALSRVMTRYWAHDPLSGRSLTLLTSTFSHQSFLHFAFNMYALYGFLPSLMQESRMSWEQTLAFYLSAGVGASLFSHVITTALWKRGLREVIPSIGASGGLWAILTAFAVVRPDAGVGLVFLPGVSFTLSELVPAMIALDCIGLARGWRSFDHAAHLGGALCGYLYTTYGRTAFAAYVQSLYKARVEKEKLESKESKK